MIKKKGSFRIAKKKDRKIQTYRKTNNKNTAQKNKIIGEKVVKEKKRIN